MIACLSRMLDAFQAAVGAARAVMDDRRPVLVEDVIDKEGCVCPRPRVVLIHDGGTRCGHEQFWLVSGACKDEAALPSVAPILDVLAAKADRRDGVRRGPR